MKWAISWFQLATDSPGDRARLGAEVQAKMTAEDLVGLDTLLLTSPDDSELHDDAGVLALLLGRAAEAVGHFRATAAQRPQSAAAHYNLGTALTSAGLLDDAVASYERALALRPDYAVALSNLGDTLAALGRTTEAERRYEQAVAAAPDLPEARNNLGAALWRRGELARAEQELRRALALRPDYAQAYFNLGHVALRRDGTGAAAAHFRRAVQLQPEWPAALVAAAWLLATAPEPDVRAPGEAVALAERAVAVTGRTDPRALDTLAVAYASAGRFDQAVATARAALALAAGSLAPDIAARLSLFERREVYAGKH